MTNKEIYKKTLTFSIRRILYDILTIILFAAICAGGFVIGDKLASNGIIGLIIGLVIAAIVAAILTRFIAYSLKAGQIAMMTRAVTEGELPDNVYAEGKRAVKERFTTVAIYFAITGAIKSVFSKIGQGISSVGGKVGGDKGNAVGSAISIALNTLVSYLCDCCLGWVFYRSEQTAVKATCEGAVLFFKHGKTLLKNMGRIFGMGLASLLVIGGAFTGVFYLVFRSFPDFFNQLAIDISGAVAESDSALIRSLSDPNILMIACAVLVGVILWSVLHSAFIRPFVLVGVLRNYIESGKDEIPSESSFSMLAGKSRKLDKLTGWA